MLSCYPCSEWYERVGPGKCGCSGLSYLEKKDCRDPRLLTLGLLGAPLEAVMLTRTWGSRPRTWVSRPRTWASRPRTWDSRPRTWLKSLSQGQGLEDRSSRTKAKDTSQGWKLLGSFRKFPGKFPETWKVSIAKFPESYLKNLENQKERN